MADPVTAGEPPKQTAYEALGGIQTRKEKRKALKKLKRKQIRKEAAIKEREEEEARSNDPAELERNRLREQEEAETAERERREFEKRERLWLEEAEKRKAEEEERRQQKLLEESERRKDEPANELEEDGEWDYVEDGPAEIVWHGNEIIVKKKRVKVAKRSADRKPDDEDADRPTSNPLPPQSVAFASYNSEQHVTAEELLQGVSQQVPNFGTEQDKTHCPFHLKTGACRFGTRCSRVHFYPDKSCTLLIKNMYNGPGLAWEQDEGLEYTDEEVERCYEEFYEDVHTEFLKFGELVNFKVCKNGSYHLRGNAYVHYKSMESSVLAYNTMNGRYFAGKQITCEFVSVTRWKVAICGEYMKSRLGTCSHGIACNFIHCFRNPGGDYEWADWDNPPPRYWIRKLAVLFGYPDESSYGMKMEQDDLESPRDSSRRRTHINGRYHSRRSCNEIKVHDSGSAREDSYRKRDRCSSHSVRREHSRARKERSYPKKTKQSDENHKSEVCNYDIKNSLRAHDSGEDRSKKKDREYLAKHKKVEERNNLDAHQSHENNIRTREESSSRQKGEDFSDKQERSERNHRSKSSKRRREEHRFYDQLSNYTGDRRNRSSSRSSEEYFRHSVDAHDRYDGRYCSNDSDSGRDRCCPSDGDSGRHCSSQNISHHNTQSAERSMDFRSRDHARHATHDNGKHGKKGKMIKRETNGDGSTSDEYPGRWETTHNDSVRQETDGHVIEGKSRSHREASKSYEKLKRYREKRKHEVHSSDSDEMYDRRAWNKYSRKQASTGCSASSEENSTKMP